MKKQEIVIVRHPPLKSADDVGQFERLVNETLAKRSDRGASEADRDIEQLSMNLRLKLISKVASLITPELIWKIHDHTGETLSARRKLVKRTEREISEYIRQELTVLTDLTKRGAKRKHAERDAEIHEMVRKGMSFGEIAIKLKIKIKRNAVQAAFRREQHRRELVLRDYPILKQALERLGIFLRENPQK